MWLTSQHPVQFLWTTFGLEGSVVRLLRPHSGYQHCNRSCRLPRRCRCRLERRRTHRPHRCRSPLFICLLPKTLKVLRTRKQTFSEANPFLAAKTFPGHDVFEGAGAQSRAPTPRVSALRVFRENQVGVREPGGKSKNQRRHVWRKVRSIQRDGLRRHRVMASVL